MSNAMMTTVPTSNIVDLVASVIGERAAIVTIETATVVKLNKKHRETGEPCPFTQGVLRRARRNVVLGSNYENVVNGRMEKRGEEPDFQAESLWKGKGRRLNRHFAYHADSGKVYLVYLPKTDKENVVVNSESEYVDIATGETVDSSEVTPFMPPYREAASGVAWRTTEVSNVTSLVYGGVKYNFAHSVTIEDVTAESPTVVEV
jgi:hypothetical protein